MTKPSREDAVYSKLRQAIIEQALRPGTKLPEDTIGESFKVSRTIARAALARLAAEGLVELRRNRGAAVASPSLSEARDVFAVRRQLEALVVEDLAGRLTPEQVEALEAHVQREDSAHGRDGPESIRLAGEFHLLLARYTGNQLLQRYVGEVTSRCSLILALYGRAHSSECAVNEHRELIRALRQGDRKKAVELMGHHLGAIQDRAFIRQAAQPPALKDVLASYGDAKAS